ncbi:MAG: hypothetical protein NZM06_09830 [Chloroherpetonaceae bacterium]|nr:hypothetical protein [Chloroherpetonaceae bacterium]MDW8437752.1 hypothetical protein [Chloroherpetonaceae bacterium]
MRLPKDIALKFSSERRLIFYYEDVRLSDEFLVAPSLSEEVIIGASTMQKWRIKLNFEADAIEIPPTAKTAILK